MKIYWWQGGIHLEPESGEDRDALMRLWNAERVQPAPSPTRSGSTGEVGIEFINDSIRDQ